jgi:putative hydrolase of the HAD superfamily
MSAPPRIKAVLFDLGGTLVDYHDFGHWAGIAQRCFLDIDEEALATAFFDVEQETDAPGKTSYTDFWRRTLSRAAGRDVDASTAERFHTMTREQPGFARLYSDSRRCLEILQAQGRRLGIVSNSRGEEQVRAMLQETGILSFFERVVSSGTEGVEKPDPEIFLRALRRMELEPHEAFYVGNLAFTDAQAAREAGLESIWLHRAGTGMSEDPPEITSLLEVPLCVERLERELPSEGGRGRPAR